MVEQNVIKIPLTWGNLRELAENTSVIEVIDDLESWEDPNNRRFTERLTASQTKDRRLIQQMMMESAQRGETGTEAAARIDDFLTPQSSPRRNPAGWLADRFNRGTERIKPTPRSGKGSSTVRTLSRTEVTRAHGMATIEASRLNPFVDGVKWNLSSAHAKSDPCDGNASGSSRGLPGGVYRAGEVPPYPEHPNCLCYLTPYVSRKTSTILRDLIRRERGPLHDIPFFIADDVEEAERLARVALGVDADYADNLQIANLTNRAMFETRDAGFDLPPRVRVFDFENPPSDFPWRQPDYEGTYAQLNLSNVTLEINSKGRWGDDAAARMEYEVGWFVTPERIGILKHELGHYNHYIQTDKDWIDVMSKWVPDEQNFDLVTGQVSRYANESMAEFVAEVFEGHLVGLRFSEEVEALYRMVGGPVPGGKLPEFAERIALREVVESHENRLINRFNQLIDERGEVYDRDLVLRANPEIDPEDLDDLFRMPRDELELELSFLANDINDMRVQIRSISASKANMKADELAKANQQISDITDLIRAAENKAEAINAILDARYTRVPEFFTQLEPARIPEGELIRGADAIGEMKEVERLWVPRLNEPQIQAVKDWAGIDIDHAWLQNWLRTNDLPNPRSLDFLTSEGRISESTFPQAKLFLQEWDENLYEAIEFSEIPRDMVAYRFIDFSRLSPWHALRNPRPGNIYHEPGFMSTTLDRLWMESHIGQSQIFRPDNIIRFEFEIPQGSRGAWVERFSDVTSEQELLFPRNTEFEILGRRGDTIAGRIIPESTFDRKPILRAQPSERITDEEYLSRVRVLQSEQRDIEKKINKIPSTEWLKENKIPGTRSYDLMEGIKNIAKQIYELRLIKEPAPDAIIIPRPIRPVNLGQGTIPTTRPFDDDLRQELYDQADKFFKESPGEWESAVAHHTSEGYRDVNEWLRGGKSPDFKPEVMDTIDEVVELDRALSEMFEASRTPNDLIVYRGLSAPDPNHPLWDPRIGMEFTDQGYGSSSIRNDWFEISNWSELNSELEIYLPRGSRAQYIEPISASVDSEIEAEMLLDKLLNYRIAGGTGNRIQIEHIPQDRPFQVPVLLPARGRPYRDLPQEVLIDEIRDATSYGRTRDLTRELRLREVDQFIEKLPEAPDLNIPLVTPSKEREIYNEAKIFWKELQEDAPEMWEAGSRYTQGDMMFVNPVRRRQGGIFTEENLTADDLIPGDATDLNRTLEELFTETIIDEDLRVFRGLSNYGNTPNPLWSQIEPGDEFIDWGFVSTSLDPDIFDDEIVDYADRLLEIFIPRGTRGKYVRPISEMEHQKEMVLGPGLRYRILGRSTTDTELPIITVEIVPESQLTRLARQQSSNPNLPNPPDLDEQRQNLLRAVGSLSEQDINQRIPYWALKEIELGRKTTRFQMRDIAAKDRPAIQSRIDTLKRYWASNPEQKDLTERAYFPNRFYEPPIPPGVLELPDPPRKGNVFFREPAKTDPLADKKRAWMEKNPPKVVEGKTALTNRKYRRPETETEYIQRMAVALRGGGIDPQAALRVPADIMAKDAQQLALRDMAAEFGITPDRLLPRTFGLPPERIVRDLPPIAFREPTGIEVATEIFKGIQQADGFSIRKLMNVLDYGTAPYQSRATLDLPSDFDIARVFVRELATTDDFSLDNLRNIAKYAREPYSPGPGMRYKGLKVEPRVKTDTYIPLKERIKRLGVDSRQRPSIIQRGDTPVIFTDTSKLTRPKRKYVGPTRKPEPVVKPQGRVIVRPPRSRPVIVRSPQLDPNEGFIGRTFLRARPSGAVVREILEGNTPPEMTTRFRGLTPEELLQNFEDELGVDAQTLLRDFPAYPISRELLEAREIADTLPFNHEISFDWPTDQNLYKEAYDQLNNAMVDQALRGERIPARFLVMPREEMIDMHGMQVQRRTDAIASFMSDGKKPVAIGLQTDPDKKIFWTSDGPFIQQRNNGYTVFPDRVGAILHETGHWIHNEIEPGKFRQSINIGAWDQIAKDFDIARRVGRYAASSANEFVAEMYAGRRSGALKHLWDDDLDRLYRDLGGPEGTLLKARVKLQ